MERSSSTSQQDHGDEDPEEIMPGVQQEQGLKTQKDGTDANYPSTHRVETIWNDFWHIPLKDRLTIWLTLLLLAVGIITAWVFYKQLGIMDDTLGEIRSGGNQTERLAITSVGQLIVSGKAAASAAVQAQAAQDSVKAIQRQMQIAERAWITIDPPTTPMAVAENQSLAATFKFTNIGNTAAQHVTFEVVLELVKNGKHPSFDYRWDHYRATTGLFVKNEPIFLQGQTYVRKRSLKPDEAVIKVLTPDEYKEFSKGEIYVASYARVTYADIFGIQHWTKLCSFSASPLPSLFVTAQKCTGYGSIDKN